MAKSLKISGVTGVNEVLRKLGTDGARELTNDLDRVVEINALKIVNEAKKNAPRRDGLLKNSINIYGKKVKLMRTIGSDRPYARRQEYEHTTKKGYFRKALWNGREPFRKDIQDAIKKRGG